MSGFSSFFQKNKTEKPKKSPAKLIQPSIGRIVELEVTIGDDSMNQRYMTLLEAYAEGIREYLVDYKITDRRIKFTFKDGEVAQKVREIFA